MTDDAAVPVAYAAIDAKGTIVAMDTNLDYINGEVASWNRYKPPVYYQNVLVHGPVVRVSLARTPDVPETHQEAHARLHHALDELLANYMRHTGNLILDRPVSDIMEWSYGQTKNPTEVADG